MNHIIKVDDLLKWVAEPKEVLYASQVNSAENTKKKFTVTTINTYRVYKNDKLIHESSSYNIAIDIYNDIQINW